MYNMLALFETLRGQGLSERRLALESELSRVSLRALIKSPQNSRLDSLMRVTRTLDRDLYLVSGERNTCLELSVQSVAHLVLRDGFASWKIHFMNFVDEFRRRLDARLILCPPSKELDLRLQALLASMVSSLCREVGMDAPEWAQKIYHLETPWFVSESEALKAMMILEAPLEFRKNLIFVAEDFLKRA